MSHGFAGLEWPLCKLSLLHNGSADNVVPVCCFSNMAPSIPPTPFCFNLLDSRQASKGIHEKWRDGKDSKQTANYPGQRWTQTLRTRDENIPPLSFLLTPCNTIDKTFTKGRGAVGRVASVHAERDTRGVANESCGDACNHGACRAAKFSCQMGTRSIPRVPCKWGAVTAVLGHPGRSQRD